MNSVPPHYEGSQIAMGLVPSHSILGDDEEDTILLRKMSSDARQYICRFSWCEAVLESYFGGGVGGIFAVFFFHIRSRHVDPWMWIIVGDIPPAYLPLSDCASPREVFTTYVHGVSRWVEFARTNQPGISCPPDVPPVDLPPTPEWADKITQKLHVLTFAVKPFFDEASKNTLN
jgi:hypothetical protein